MAYRWRCKFLMGYCQAVMAALDFKRFYNSSQRHSVVSAQVNPPAQSATLSTGVEQITLTTYVPNLKHNSSASGFKM